MQKEIPMPRFRVDYKQFTCPVKKAVTIVGDKWVLFILREFFYSAEKQRFNELLRALKPISSRTLSLKLKRMEACGLVKRTVLHERPIRVQYSITKKGLALKRALQAMADWFKKYEIS